MRRASAARHLQALATALAFAGAIVLASLLLDALARVQLHAHLVESATRTLAALVHGGAPLRWNPARAADIVGATAFDAASSRIDGRGLHARSDGRPLEVGLVLGVPIDLERLGIAEVDLDTGAVGTLAFSLRGTLDGPLCSSSTSALAPGVQTLRIDLDALAWRCGDAGPARPARAAMLRLRLHLPAAADVRLADVRLYPRIAFDPQAIESLHIGPSVDAAAVHALERVARSRWPLVELDLDARVESVLSAVDRIRAATPAALVVPAGESAAVLADARMAPSAAAPTPGTPLLAWTLVAVLAATLAWIRLRAWSSPRVQAAAELAAVAGIPLALLASGAIGDDLAAPTFAALGLCVAFAASLLKGGAPPQPTTRTWLRGALVAIASVAVALALVALLRDPAQAWSMPPATRVLRYLGWAAVQQFLVTVIIAGCIERITGSPRVAVVLAAFVFAVLHAPNAMLMQFTFLGGLIWTWNWQRHRAVLANTLAHAACGLLLADGLPPQWLRSAEIGARYFLS